jgi:hypothetical protein
MTKADSVWWDIQLYFSLDNGNSWINTNIFEQLDSLWGGILRNIAISPTGIAYCGLLFFQPPMDLNGLFAKSTDDGLIWTYPGWIKGGQIFSFNYESVITIGEGWREITINLSSDNGNSWNYLGGPPAFYTRALALFSNGNIIVGDGEQYNLPKSVYISTNTCSTWTIISDFNSLIKSGFSWSNGEEEGILIGTEDLGVFLFSDEGDSLGPRNDGLTNLNVQALTLDNNGYVYAGTDDGVWRRSLFEIIPVELTSFIATSNGSEVILNWSTATETNNSGFSIERKIANSEYSEIGFIPGFGTTTETKSYSYIDSKVSQGKYTYHLKQIDFDGSYEYSQEYEVEVSAPLEFSLEQNFPNPFNPSTVINYQLPINGNVTIKVYDIIGNEISILVNDYKLAGKYEIEFNPASGNQYSASGIYFYQLKAGNYIDTKKMILIK